MCTLRLSKHSKLMGSLVIFLLVVTTRQANPVAAKAANSRTAQSVILYDGRLGGMPDSQGMFYQTIPFPASAIQSFADEATWLDTNPSQMDHAGYFGNPALMMALDRHRGYVLRFTVQVTSEIHAGSDKDGDGLGDRAGLSVIALSQDLQGIELGFWQDQVWAQEDGSAEPPSGTLFTHAESAAFDTTASLLPYQLTILGDSYFLATADTAILQGRLRDYTLFDGNIDPYETPNLIFLGDDTTSARAAIGLSFVSVANLENLYLPLVTR